MDYTIIMHRGHGSGSKCKIWNEQKEDWSLQTIRYSGPEVMWNTHLLKLNADLYGYQRKQNVQSDIVIIRHSKQSRLTDFFVRNRDEDSMQDWQSCFFFSSVAE